MKGVSPARITELCEKWCAEYARPEGMGPIGESYRLLANGVVFPDLTKESMSAAIIGLSRVLLHPRMNTVISRDHFYLWAWFGELLREQLAYSDSEFWTLYEALLRSALAPISFAQQYRSGIEPVDLERQCIHLIRFCEKSHVAMAYLGFPLLEALLKRACAKYVKNNGRIIKKFEISGPDGPTTYNKGGLCSSVGALLKLHYKHVAPPDLVSHLDTFRDHIRGIDKSRDPYDLFYKWRNNLLHGTDSYNTIGGTLLNLALLISMYELPNGYEKARIHTIKRLDNLAGRPLGPWSFYPPC